MHSDGFKDVVFLYESAALPPELQVVAGITAAFQATPEAATTLVQVCHSVEQAALEIQTLKEKTCGTAYSMAVLNLNLFGPANELAFLLRNDILGDPRTIFLASLRYMTGETYSLAKQKLEREAPDKTRTPSCIDCYSAHNRQDAHTRISQLLCAYLREAEARLDRKRNRKTTILEPSEASELLRKSETTYFGEKRTKTSGEWRALGAR